MTEASRAGPATTTGADVGPGLSPGSSWAWRPVAAPADVTWRILADTSFWPRWGPSVRAVEPHSGPVASGQRGRVRTVIGPWVPFVVDEVDPGRSWRWTVAGVAVTHHAVEATGPRSSRVGIGVPRLAFPYLAICRVALGRIARLAEAAT